MTGELTGKTLGNRYRFDALIGSGTFAHVYRITDIHRRATLAAKVLRRDIAQDSMFLERFQREAEVLDRLQHPNIVRYYDIIEIDQTVFILLDYIPGITLENILQEAKEPLKPYSSFTYLMPLASALHFAHNESVIHRDLKPANILLHENKTLYITDFGIARLLNTTSELTVGIAIGTPFYMAPEQITGDPVTIATDIYALGIILYRMYTGYLPFRGQSAGIEGDSTATRVTREQVHADPVSLRTLNSSVDLAIEEIVLRCLAKDPAKRFGSVSDLYDALAEAVGAPPIPLEAPLSQDESVDPSAPPNMKLPEWSQYVPRVGQDNQIDSDLSRQAPGGDEDTLPPASGELPTIESGYSSKTVDKIEHPVPQPITKPHLEDQLRPRASQPDAARTIPALERLARRDPAPPAHPIAPPQPVFRSPYHAVSYDDRQPKRNWTLIGSVIGILLVVLSACIAAIYLTQLSGDNEDDNNTDLTRTAVIAGENLNPTPFSTEVTTQEQPGSHIAFDSRRNGNYDIFIMNTDGTGLRQLAGTANAERGPAWSPDGTRIAFYAAATENSSYDIYVINVDGTGLQNLTNSPTVSDMYPTWSPDGTQIAYHSDADGDFDLYIINTDGSGQRAITSNDVDDFGPDWSPEGTQIVFHTGLWDEPYEIAVIDLNTLNVRQLTNTSNTSAFPTWSPDGARIAFHSFAEANEVNLYVMSLDGSPAARVTNTGGYNAFPDWSPDGTYLIYHSGQNYESAIMRIPVAGGTPEAVTGTQANYLADWEPD